MRRIAVLGALVSALSVFAFSVAVSTASADDCTTNGSYKNCTYWNGSLQAGNRMYSIYNYWYKTRMWRPMNNFASLYFENSSYCCNAYNSNYGDNPFATKGYFGYDRAWCENESQVMLWPVTCVVYNWDA